MHPSQTLRGQGKVKRGAAPSPRLTRACKRPPIAYAPTSLRPLAAPEAWRYCAKKAWRLLQGESPCRVRASHPPVSRLASMAESWEHGEQDGRGVDSVSCRPQGEPRPLTCWYSFDMALVADAEGFHAHRRQHESIRFGEDGQVRRRPQAVAGRKRDVEELGRPQTLL
jgi:hypothetical protein